MDSGIKQLKPGDFYLVQNYHDAEANADIQVLVPVCFPGDRDASPDPERLERYFSSIIINIGPQRIPWRFEIGASSLWEAIALYAKRANEEGEKAIAHYESEMSRARLLTGVPAASQRAS